MFIWLMADYIKRSFRGDKKLTLEETRRIDVRYLHQRGYLKDDVCGTLAWSCGDEPSGLINIAHQNGVLTLSYRMLIGGDVNASLSSNVSIFSKRLATMVAIASG